MCEIQRDIENKNEGARKFESDWCVCVNVREREREREKEREREGPRKINREDLIKLFNKLKICIMKTRRHKITSLELGVLKGNFLPFYKIMIVHPTNQPLDRSNDQSTGQRRQKD